MATFLLSEVVLRELLVQLTLGRSFLYFVKSFSSFPDFAKALANRGDGVYDGWGTEVVS